MPSKKKPLGRRRARPTAAPKKAPVQKSKPLVAIYDLTDCEGCELAFVPVVEAVAKTCEIVEWRLTQEKRMDIGDRKIDVAFVEGSPMSAEDREFLGKLRERTKVLVALGACACIGGVPALAGTAEREKFMSLVYSPEYKPKSDTPALPLDTVVKVDYYLHGCPVLPEMAARFLEQVLVGKAPDKFGGYPVCLPCKAAGNPCLLIQGNPCLGPVSAGNCGAPCPTFGKVCYGCTGAVKGGNFTQMRHKLAEILGEEMAEAHLRIFLKDEKGKR